MPVARPESSDSRVIAHVDMDCFYVQVEQRKQPSLRGLPAAVVQYNSWKGGGLIAVSYEARKYGVKRSMRGDDAKEVCPEIHLVRVPEARGKADLSIYRNAGSEVVSILSRKGRCERASIDEVYLDITDAAEAMLEEAPPESSETIDEEVLKSHVLGLSMNASDDKENVRQWIRRSDADRRDKLLACGAIIVAELRTQVLKESEFTCSAGISHNKMLAKLASGMNKPAQQTVVPFSSVKGLLEPLPIKKMKQLGGKLGSSLQIDLGVNTVGDLLQFSEDKLQDRYGVNTGTWLWNIARGISGEEVEGRLLPKSHGSGKTFPGPRALRTIDSVEQWLNGLCEELSERLCSDLDQNKRIAHTLTLHANAHQSTDSDSFKKFPSKSCPLRYGTAKIQEDAFNLFQAALREYLGSYNNLRGHLSSGWRITGLSVSASKIVAIPSGTGSITKYFHTQDQSQSLSKQLDDKFTPEAAPLSPSGHSESCPRELQTEYGSEHSSIKHDRPNIVWQDQYCSSSKQARDDFNGEVIALPSADNSCMLKETGAEFGGEDSRIAHAVFFSLVDNSCMLKETGAEFGGEDSRIAHAMIGVRSQDRKRKKLEEKGTPSIRRFFQNQDICSSSTQDDHLNTTAQRRNPSASGQPPQEAMGERSGTITGTNSLSSQDERQRSNSWSYKIDEIDPAVVNELPLEIQAEVRAWLQPQKVGNNTVKRGSSIAHYFSPNKSQRSTK